MLKMRESDRPLTKSFTSTAVAIKAAPAEGYKGKVLENGNKKSLKAAQTLKPYNANLRAQLCSIGFVYTRYFLTF